MAIMFYGIFSAEAALQNQTIGNTKVAGQGDNNVTFYFATTTSSQTLGSIAMLLGDATSTSPSVQIRITCFANNFSVSQTGCTYTGAWTSSTTEVIATNPSVYRFNFDSGIQIQNTKAYVVEILTLGGGVGVDVYGKSTLNFSNECTYFGTGIQDCNGTPYYVINPVFGPTNVQGFATTSSAFSGQNATSTLQALSEQCSQSSNLFSEGICMAFSFLFVPSSESVGQWTTLPAVIAETFPFSYFYELAEIRENLTSSTTQNFPSIELEFPITYGGTTATNTLEFSTSTITNFIPNSILTIFNTLMVSVAWLGFAGLIWSDVKRMFN